jgi:hypothetical protein
VTYPAINTDNTEVLIILKDEGIILLKEELIRQSIGLAMLNILYRNQMITKSEYNKIKKKLRIRYTN